MAANREIKAAVLSRETQAALQARHEKSPFLLVPEDSEASVSSTARSLAESLPQVWQDLFAATRAAKSTEYLDSLACSPPLPPALGLPAAVSEQGTSIPATSRSPAASATSCISTSRDLSLGITKETVFKQYLSPEALVQRHRLGKPEVRRVYQALQVYSLGFHQTLLEVTSHATNKSLLLLSIWRGFAMLWDTALQAMFPGEMVQTSRERQAALLMGERLMEQLREEQQRAEDLAQANAALRQQVDSMAVQLMSAQADTAVAQQAAARLDQRAKAAQQERTQLVGQVDAGRRELMQLQEKLHVLAGPGEDLYRKAQALEQLLQEKQAQLGIAAKQAAQALNAQEEAQQQARKQQLGREAAECRAQQLQDDLNAATLQVRAAAASAAVQERERAAAEAAAQEQQAADAAARQGEAERQATEHAQLLQRAEDAEAQVVAMREQLEAAQQQVAAGQSKIEELSSSLWPLAARVKALEAAAADRQQAAG